MPLNEVILGASQSGIGGVIGCRGGRSCMPVFFCARLDQSDRPASVFARCKPGICPGRRLARRTVAFAFENQGVGFALARVSVVRDFFCSRRIITRDEHV